MRPETTMERCLGNNIHEPVERGSWRRLSALASPAQWQEIAAASKNLPFGKRPQNGHLMRDTQRERRQGKPVLSTKLAIHLKRFEAKISAG
jgi:hypothetical protein